MSEKQQTREYLKQVIQLSIPAVLAQISSIIMQYIDASMVGSLGATATAAIGLVSSTTWLFGGLCASAATGFSVQVAQLIGAEREKDARDVLRHAILCTLVFGLIGGGDRHQLTSSCLAGRSGRDPGECFPVFPDLCLCASGRTDAPYRRKCAAVQR